MNIQYCHQYLTRQMNNVNIFVSASSKFVREIEK